MVWAIRLEAPDLRSQHITRRSPAKQPGPRSQTGSAGLAVSIQSLALMTEFVGRGTHSVPFLLTTLSPVALPAAAAVPTGVPPAIRSFGYHRNSPLLSRPAYRALTLLTDAEYRRIRRAPEPPAYLRHEDLEPLLAAWARDPSSTFRHQVVGASIEGRVIHQVALGNGPRTILLWSQMHGDERTHTTVLCDLLSFLQTTPNHPVAGDLLQACTVVAIPMLNPDGATRGTRHNAIGVDLNRDARVVQCPESQVLRTAVQTWRPEFGFNLHNHNPRRTVAGKHQLASAAIFAPPVDDNGTCTESMRTARQVCSAFVANLPASHRDAVCRYKADYMPRAFGEWVQSQGVATVLIEAGGWPTPELAQLQRMHFEALLGALHEIATNQYLHRDPDDYLAIPQTGPHDVFDVRVCSSHLLVEPNQPVTIDLGINFQPPANDSPKFNPRPQGRICELGDLEQTWGKLEIAAPGEICVAGRIAYAPGGSLPEVRDAAWIAVCLQNGITTLLCELGLGVASAAEVGDWWRQLSEQTLPLNVGLIASGNAVGRLPSLEDLTAAVGAGILALAIDSSTESLSGYAADLGVPTVAQRDLESCRFDAPPPETVTELTTRTRRLADALRLEDHGRVALGRVADLLWFADRSDSSGVIELRDLRRVMVGGTVVWRNGARLQGAGGGSLLQSHRTVESRAC